MAKFEINIDVNGEAKIKSLETSLKGLDTSGSKTSSMMDKISSSTGGLVNPATLAALATYKMAEAFTAAAVNGINFNRQIETTKIGLSSLIAVSSQNVDSLGKQLTAQQKYAMAQAQSVEVLEALKIANKETSATLLELTQGFQAALAPASAAGLSMKQTVEYTKLMTQAAGAMGVPMNQLSQELKSVVSGNIDLNSVVASNLGITNDQIKKHKEQGDLFVFLQGKLSDFATAGKDVAKSFDGSMSTMSDAWDELTGELMQPLNIILGESFVGAAEVFSNLAQSIKDFKLQLSGAGDITSLADIRRKIVLNKTEKQEVKNDKWMPDSEQKRRIKELDDENKILNAKLTSSLKKTTTTGTLVAKPQGKSEDELKKEKAEADRIAKEKKSKANAAAKQAQSALEAWNTKKISLNNEATLTTLSGYDKELTALKQNRDESLRTTKGKYDSVTVINKNFNAKKIELNKKYNEEATSNLFDRLDFEDKTIMDRSATLVAIQEKETDDIIAQYERENQAIMDNSKILMDIEDKKAKASEILTNLGAGNEFDKLTAKYQTAGEKLVALGQLSDENAKKLGEAFNEEFNKLQDFEINIKLTGFDDVSNGIAGIANGLSGIQDLQTDYNKAMKDAAGNTEKQDKLTQKYADNTMGSYVGIIDSMSNFYDEDDDRRKKQMKLAKFMHQTQMAMQLASLTQTISTETAKSGVLATNALVAQLQLPFPANIPAYAMVAAMIASLGIALGGSGGSSTPTAPDYTKTIESANFGVGENARQGVDLYADYNGNVEKFIEGLDSAAEKLKAFGNDAQALSKTLVAVQSVGLSDEVSKRLTESLADSIDFELLDKSQLEALLGNFDATAYDNTLRQINDIAIRVKNGEVLTKAETESLITLLSMPDYIKGRDYQDAIDRLKELNDEILKNAQSLTKETLAIISFNKEMKTAGDSLLAFGIQTRDSFKAIFNGILTSLSNMKKLASSTIDAQTGADRKQFWELDRQFKASLASGDMVKANEAFTALVGVGNTLSMNDKNIAKAFTSYMNENLSLLNATEDILKVEIVGGLADLLELSTDQKKYLKTISADGVVTNDELESLNGLSDHQVAQLKDILKKGSATNDELTKITGLSDDQKAYLKAINADGEITSDELTTISGLSDDQLTNLKAMLETTGLISTEESLNTSIEVARLQLKELIKTTSQETAGVTTQTFSYLDYLGKQEQYDLAKRFQKPFKDIEEFILSIQSFDIKTPTEDLAQLQAMLKYSFDPATGTITYDQATTADLSKLWDVLPQDVKDAYGTLSTMASQSQEAYISGKKNTLNTSLASNITKEQQDVAQAQASTNYYNSLLGVQRYDSRSATPNSLVMGAYDKQEITERNWYGNVKARYDVYTLNTTKAIADVQSKYGLGQQTNELNVANQQYQDLLNYINSYKPQALPSFDVGSPYIPNDMTANIHQGEMIIDAKTSSQLRRYGLMQQGNEALVRLVESSNERLNSLVHKFTSMEAMFRQVTTGGNAMMIEMI